MEKTLQENEIKELDEEIDSAVDRLFVEKRKGHGESLLQEPPSTISPALESAEKPDRAPDVAPETIALPPPAPSPQPQPPSELKAIDPLEAHLLSLEWEITEEKLQRTQEEVRGLGDQFKQKSDIWPVLGFMDRVLDKMRADEKNILPPMVKFLLDAKETIKLLLNEETDKELNVYKNLAREGIEARFTGLEGMRGPLIQSSPVPREETVPQPSLIEWKKVEEALTQGKVFFEKAEEVLHQIEQRLSQLSQIEKAQPEPPVPSGKEKLPLMDITIFKAYGKLYGVESQRIWKLYKIPASFQDKYAQMPKIRLKDLDVTLIDLKKAFPEESWHRGEMSKLLIVQEEGEYQGLLVEEVVKRLTISPEEDQGEKGNHVLGIVPWIYQTHPVEIPILNLKAL
ncbi:MAG TPA: chemotaxis protein CheW [Thermodesulfobacteriota bacterium]|nr:chemotaxis protein CheW [Thermodesulfobacteriota bacterium]